MKWLEALFCLCLQTVCNHLTAFIGICNALPVFCVIGILIFGEKGEDFSWVFALLITPYITQVSGSIYLYIQKKNSKDETWKYFYIAFFSSTMAASSGFHLAMWFFFSSDKAANIIFENKDDFSTICLLLIISQILILILTAYWIRKPLILTSYWMKISLDPPPDVVPKHTKDYNDDEVINSIIKGLKDFPFLSLVHFFAIFFSIAYLFGFAFAFHDKATQPYALHKEKFVLEISSNKSIPQPNPNVAPIPSPSPNTMPICFYFDEGKAELETKQTTEKRQLTEIEQRKNFKNNLNDKALTTFKDQFPTNAHQQTRIRLLGRASEPSTNKSSYLSNYELSQARIQVIRFEIAKKLFEKYSGKWVNIDWILIPYSSESTSQGDENKCNDLEDYDEKSKKTTKDINSGRRVVQAYINSISDDPDSIQIKNQIENSKKQDWEKCSLMDYMYFSIYTITTTGYGDIKPATTYSKFLVSLENFFEVFFLAGFLNILISLKDQNDESKGKGDESKEKDDEQKVEENSSSQ